MTRKIIFAVFVLSVLSVVGLFGIWKTGRLYFRMSTVEITLNGDSVNDGKIYRTGTGDYLIFLETERANFPVYAVTDDGSVGIPGSPIPSSYTKSVKTDSFVLCLQCLFTPAGTDKFDLNASVFTSREEIAFRVTDDSVSVKF